MISRLHRCGSVASSGMGVLRLLVLCTLAACCVARSPPGPPLPNAPFAPLRSLGCNDSEVLAVAGFALQNINRVQKDGYMLTLNRVHDARVHRQEDMGSLFYLTLDVLETGCHVLSRKALKDCGPRIFYETVHGQCKAMFHVNKPRRVLYLPAYNCTLRPVSKRKIHSMCPDCPHPVDLSSPSVLEAATESLAKFNSENPSKQYALVKVTKATSQWVVGPSYFVEYLIKESPCTQSQDSCSLQASDSEPVGLCQGSLIKSPGLPPQPGVPPQRFKKTVTVSCEFFESQDQVPGGENPADTQDAKKLPQKNADPTSSPSITAPRGSIQHLPEQEEPEGSKGKSPEEPFPVQLDLTTNPQGDTLDVSFLYLEPEEKKLVVLPFPGKEQRSPECPGPEKQRTP